MRHTNLDENAIQLSNQLVKVIIERLKNCGLTTYQFSTGSGYSQPYLSNLINGKYRPEKLQLGTVVKLASSLGLHLSLEFGTGQLSFKTEDQKEEEHS